jgi:hypothetical protein
VLAMIGSPNAGGGNRAAVWLPSAGVLRRASNHSQKSTAKWLARQMLHMDWTERHECYNSILLRKPAGFIIILDQCFGPDQLMNGTLSGTGCPSGGAIILKDKSRGRLMVQSKIEQFFAKKRRQ